ncbi:MAG: rhodanese-like domain-containing protein [Anaerolineales bacterium]|nr:rhodanese-like domain-containing protein [Anaerolineales bacterium]
MDFLRQLFGPPVPGLSAAEVQMRLKASPAPLLLDVREPEEYRAGHIAGAKLIPLGELSRRLNELPQNREIVCVCRSGSRSHSAARQLIKSGYNAVNLRGGMLAWVNAGLPTKTGK